MDKALLSRAPISIPSSYACLAWSGAMPTTSCNAAPICTILFIHSESTVASAINWKAKRCIGTSICLSIQVHPLYSIWLVEPDCIGKIGRRLLHFSVYSTPLWCLVVGICSLLRKSNINDFLDRNGSVVWRSSRLLKQHLEVVCGELVL